MPTLQYRDNLYTGDVIANSFERMLRSAQETQVRRQEVERRMVNDSIQAEAEKLRLQIEQAKLQDQQSRTPSEIAKNKAVADYDLSRTATEDTKRSSATALGDTFFSRSQPVVDDGSGTLVPNYMPTVEGVKQYESALARKHAAVLQALSDPSKIGQSVSGTMYGLQLPNANQEAAFAGMAEKAGETIAPGGLHRSFITGKEAVNPEIPRTPNQLSMEDFYNREIVKAATGGQISPEALQEVVNTLTALGIEAPKRKVGERRTTSKGTFVWSGTGWKKVE